MAWIHDIVTNHKPRKGEASIYGVVLYDDSHPHVKQAIYDDDYWKAFDEISGNSWAIFSTRLKQGILEYPSNSPGVLFYMVPVWKEPAANKELLDTFQLESTESLPLLVVFALKEDGNVLKINIPLNDNSKINAYESLKSGIKAVSKSLQRIGKGNIQDPDGVYSAVSFAVQNLKDWERIKNGIKIWRWFKSLI